MPSLTTRQRRWLLLFAGTGFIVYVSIVLAVDAPLLGQGLMTLGFSGIMLVLLGSLINYTLRFLRWRYYMTALGHRIPLNRHAAYYLGGFAFTVSPGKAGEALRSLYLRQHDVPYSHSLAALFTERLQDLLAICTLAAITAGGIAGYRSFGLSACAALLLLSLGLTWRALPKRLQSFATRQPGRTGRAAASLATLLDASAVLLRPRRLYWALAVSVLAWGAEGLALWWLGRSLGVALTPESGTAIYAVSVLAGAAAFFLPAGLGGMEAAMTLLLTRAGAGLDIAFIITALCRLATLWFAVLLGLLALFWLELHARLAPLSNDDAASSLR